MVLIKDVISPIGFEDDLKIPEAANSLGLIMVVFSSS